MATFNYTVTGPRSGPTTMEWTGRLTRKRWKDLLELMMYFTWDGGDGTWTGILSVDDQAYLAIELIVRTDRYYSSRQLGEFVLLNLQKDRPIGRYVIKSFVTAE